MIYGYLCEDLEQETFIEACLPMLVDSGMVKCKTFKKAEEFCAKIKPPSADRTYVRKNFANAAKQGFAVYDLDFFVATIDYDSNPPEKYQEYIKQCNEEYDNRIKRRSVMAIPIQAIEYWLWYLKHKNQNPAEEQIENDATFNRVKAKEDIFTIQTPTGGTFSLSKYKRADVTKALLQNADLKWLVTKSPSFRAFVDQVKEFCSHFSSKE